VTGRQLNDFALEFNFPLLEARSKATTPVIIVTLVTLSSLSQLQIQLGLQLNDFALKFNSESERSDS
jgi:hypothetical protein